MSRHQTTSEPVFEKEVKLNSFDKDKYGRTIADVILPDGTNVSHALVKDGLAWWYRKYAPDDVTVEKLEAEARELKRNLWSHKKSVPPWVYTATGSRGRSRYRRGSGGRKLGRKVRSGEYAGHSPDG